MKVQILGYTRLTGVSKAGKDYDFFSVAIAYSAEPGYTGKRVKEITISPVLFDKYATGTVPFTADVEIDFNGHVVGVYV